MNEVSKNCLQAVTSGDTQSAKLPRQSESSTAAISRRASQISKEKYKLLSGLGCEVSPSATA